MEGVHQRSTGGRWVSVMIFSVEIPVAVAGGALERFEGPFLSAGHELPTAVGDVPPDTSGVVLEAFPVAKSRVRRIGFGHTGIGFGVSRFILLSIGVFQRVIVSKRGALHPRFLVFTSKRSRHCYADLLINPKKQSS